MTLRDFAGDEKTEAQSALAMTVCMLFCSSTADQGLEHRLLQIRWNRWAFVMDPNAGVFVRFARRDPDGRFVAVLDGVQHEIRQHLLDRAGAEVPGQGRRTFQLDVPVRTSGPTGICGIVRRSGPPRPGQQNQDD